MKIDPAWERRRGAKAGAVKVDIGQEWPLSEVAAAHTALAARKTTGASVLIP
jgi:NADPH2:quinone reductase